MNPVHRVGDLEIDDDPAFSRVSWVVKRVGWALMLLLVAAAAVGLFGEGPLSDTRKRAGDHWIRYERFGRLQAPVRIEVHPGPSAVRDGVVEIGFDGELVGRVEIESVTPAPLEGGIGEDTYLYRFAAPAEINPPPVLFRVSPHTIGRLDGTVFVGDEAIALETFVFP